MIKFLGYICVSKSIAIYHHILPPLRFTKMIINFIVYLVKYTMSIAITMVTGFIMVSRSSLVS